MKNSTSVPHTPTRSTSTTTSPTPACGAGTSRTEHSPGAVTTAARMVRPLNARRDRSSPWLPPAPATG
ncbi:hypothetical protein ACFQZ4_01950 [Catellatospora coxensis]